MCSERGQLKQHKKEERACPVPRSCKSASSFLLLKLKKRKEKAYQLNYLVVFLQGGGVTGREGKGQEKGFPPLLERAGQTIIVTMGLFLNNCICVDLPEIRFFRSFFSETCKLIACHAGVELTALSPVHCFARHVWQGRGLGSLCSSPRSGYKLKLNCRMKEGCRCCLGQLLDIVICSFIVPQVVL